LNQQSTLQEYKPDNTTHVGQEGITSVKIHDEAKETIRVHLTLVHVFHAYALTAGVELGLKLRVG
jgi:hypothetical protein